MRPRTAANAVARGQGGHGSIPDAPLAPHAIERPSGPLAEIPISVLELRGRRFCLFGGGYLRLTPLSILRWGIDRLHDAGLPLIVYIHPREIDPDHPRLPLGFKRNFKSYVNLHTTMPKLKWLLKSYSFCTMRELVARLGMSARADEPAVPAGPRSPEPGTQNLGSGSADSADCRRPVRRSLGEGG